jgi:hypothetical protein
MSKLLTPEQQRKARERRQRYNEKIKAKVAAAANDPTPPNFAHTKMPSKAEIESRRIHMGGTSLLDPPTTPSKAEEYGDVEELHPCAVAVCLSCFFAMAYKETPPGIPRELLYEGILFRAEPDRRTNEIVLSTKADAFHTSAPAVARRFPMETFRRVYVEA